MPNAEFAKLLSQAADLLELDDDNPFRIRAFRRAAQTIEYFPKELSALSRTDRLAIPGIGKGIADMLEEFEAKGSVSELNRLKKKYPSGVLEMMSLVDDEV